MCVAILYRIKILNIFAYRRLLGIFPRGLLYARTPGGKDIGKNDGIWQVYTGIIQEIRFAYVIKFVHKLKKPAKVNKKGEVSR